MSEDTRYYGKYRGIVTVPVDTGSKGRITALVTMGGVPATVVAEACMPFGGVGSGFFAVPPSGAGVWIEFEEGDKDKPIWTGCWWSEGELPASFAVASTASPLESMPVVIQSLGGNHIVIGATPADGIRIETSLGLAGPSITLNAQSILLADGKGGGIAISGGTVVVNLGALVVK
jgi:hypothetical protein